MKFTILGGAGFIGSHVVAHLRREGLECRAPGRDDPTAGEGELGHVIYCIGVTADFRRRPLETVRAHVCRLLDVLEGGRFESLLYLSSARVYGGAERADERQREFRVDPGDPNNLYNLSKLMGESACLASGRAGVRVARLSNVYGGDWSSENFLTAIIREAVDEGRILLRSDGESAKDYVSVSDVAPLLVQIALGGREQVYNVAGGENVTNLALAEGLRRVTGCAVAVSPGAPRINFPPIAIERVRAEFGFAPAAVLDSLETLVADYRGQKGEK